MSIGPLSSKFALLILLAAAGEASRAAESYDGCTGYIDSVPAVVSSQGTWCLRDNVSTAITNGAAITVAANNVTIDCNDFKVGGLAAGALSFTSGIKASQSRNVSIRNCTVRGFYRGIDLGTGSGNLVEGNLVDHSLLHGIYAGGSDNIVRDNRVFDTGGKPGLASAYAIVADGDISGNTVTGVFADATDASPFGIVSLYASGNVVRGNRIIALASSGNGYARGIAIYSPDARIADNWIAISNPGTDYGVFGSSSNTFCVHNTASSATNAFSGCDASHGNLP